MATWDVTAKCIAYWKMDDNAVNTAVDDCVGAFDGVANNNTNLMSASGKLGTSLQMGQAVSGGVDFQNPIPNLNTFAIEFWIKTGFQGFYSEILDKGGMNLPTNGGWTLQVSDYGDGLYIRCDTSEGNNQCGANLNKDTGDMYWHHLVYNFYTSGDTGYVDAYRDSVLAGSMTYLLGTGIGNTLDLSIPAWLDNPAYFDNIRVYNTILTQDEITGLFNKRAGTIELSGTVPEWDDVKLYLRAATDKVGSGAKDLYLRSDEDKVSSAVVYTFNGNIPISLIPSHTVIKIKVITGAVSLSLMPGSGVIKIKIYAGSVALSLTPSGSPHLVKVYAGNITLSLTPNSLASVAHNFTQVGSILLTLTPSHTVKRSYARIGAVSITLTPNSSSKLTKVFAGNISLTLTPGSAVVKIKLATGNITLSLTPNSVSHSMRVCSGNISLSLTPSCSVKRVFNVIGDLDVILTPQGAYYLDKHGITYLGNIQLVITPASGVVRVWSQLGEVLFTLTPNSEGGYALLELVRLNSLITKQSGLVSTISPKENSDSNIEKTEVLDSPIDFNEDVMTSNIEKTVSLSSTIREAA